MRAKGYAVEGRTSIDRSLFLVLFCSTLLACSDARELDARGSRAIEEPDVPAERDAGVEQVQPPAESTFVFVQTTQSGIHSLRLNEETGELTLLATTLGPRNPLYMRAHDRRLFVVGDGLDALATYRADLGSGVLTYVGQAPTKQDVDVMGMNGTTRQTIGRAPVHVAVDATGTHAVTADYAGHTSFFSIDEEGVPSLRDIEATGVTSHSAVFAPSGEFVYTMTVRDRSVTQFRVDREEGQLERVAAFTDPRWAPRHAAISADGRCLYVINERPHTVMSFELGTNGYPTFVGEISATPEPIAAPAAGAMPSQEWNQRAGAEIAVNPAGDRVFASMRYFADPPGERNDNVLIAMNSDPETCRLEVIEYEPSGGLVPRGFALAPSGRFLFVANEWTGNVVTFRIENSGALTPVAEFIDERGEGSIGIAVMAPN